MFAGYYDNPEANAKAFRDGWFRTGDLGHVDEEGFLYITGRASDMYISGGSNVYPRETEEKILTHPAIAEVAILGVPDTTWGEVGVAVCVLRPEAALNERELLAWLDGKVSRYKLPKRVFFWDALAEVRLRQDHQEGRPRRSWRRAAACPRTSRSRLRPEVPTVGPARRFFGDALGRTQPNEDLEEVMSDRQIVLVTGGASGIGLAIVEAVLAEGWRAIVADLDQASLDRCRDVLGASDRQVRFERMNVADEEAVIRVDRGLRERSSGRSRESSIRRVSAGTCRRSKPASISSAEMLEVNLIGSFVVSREAAKHMRARGAGSIVNIASVSGIKGNKGRVAYGASKGGVLTMTKVMAVELAPVGIRVNAIAPGPIETPLVQEIHTPEVRAAWMATVPQRRYGSPAEIAGAAIFLLDDRKSSYVTGQTICVDGGFTSAGIMGEPVTAPDLAAPAESYP